MWKMENASSYLSTHINCHNILKDAFSSLMHKKFKSRFCANITERPAVSHTWAPAKSHLGIFERESEKKYFCIFPSMLPPRHFSLFLYSVFLIVFPFFWFFCLPLAAANKFFPLGPFTIFFCVHFFGWDFFWFCCRRRNGFISCAGAIKFVI